MSHHVQLLGCAGPDHSPSIVLTLDTQRYLINTGEGTQRLCTQHGIRMGRVKHLLYTRAAVETLGGYPGLSITLADLGVQQLTVYGVPGTAEFIEGIKAFSIRQQMKVDVKEIQTEGIIMKDQHVAVKAINMGNTYRKMRTRCQHQQHQYQQFYQYPRHPPPHQQQEHGSSMMEHNVKTPRSLPSHNEDDEAIAAADADPHLLSHHQSNNNHNHHPGPLSSITVSNSVVSYIFELSCTPGKFDPQKAKSLGLKPGPIFAQLKAGQTVEVQIEQENTEQHGQQQGQTGKRTTTRLIHPHECVGPVRRGAVFAVIDLPFRRRSHRMNRWIERLRHNTCFSAYRQQPHQPDSSARIDLMLHLSAACILAHPLYMEWMHLFGPHTQHVFINHSLSPQRSLCTSSAIQQQKLQTLASSIFTAAESTATEGDSGNCNIAETTQQELFLSLKKQQHFPANSVIGTSLMKYSLLPTVSALPLSSPPSSNFDLTAAQVKLRQLQRELDSILQSRTSDSCSNVSLSAEAIAAITADIGLQPAPLSGSAAAVDNFRPSPSILSNLSLLSPAQAPELVFLGTGSAIPSKYRNVTGIFFHPGSVAAHSHSSVSVNDRSGGFLLDCGEGTLGQCVRKWGVSVATQRLSNLSIVFISHLHADHHLGLLSIIQLFKETEARRRQHEQQGTINRRKLHIIGPRKLLPWLITSWTHTYEQQIQQDNDDTEKQEQEDITSHDDDDGHQAVEDDLLDWIEFFPCHECISSPHALPPLLSALSSSSSTPLISLHTVPVRHCADSYGLVLHTASPYFYKLVYSGDTLPCQSLIDAGADATVVIHEATFSSDLQQEAKLKKHTTSKQATQVAALMRAQRVILTHFSQRYPKLPDFDTVNTLQSYSQQRSIIAFDLMTIPWNQLHWLPFLTPLVATLLSETETIEEADEQIEEEDTITVIGKDRNNERKEMQVSTKSASVSARMLAPVHQQLGKRKLESGQ